MKLNQSEKLALKTIRNILVAIENGNEITVTSAEQNAIIKLIGVNLKEITVRKKEVKSFVRGKDNFKIIFKKPFADWHEANQIKSYGFFPFQVKELM
ncbi:hypothetical protein G1L02_08335 [Tenacibaculum finnmarkense]|uniref:Uncharacterized protein n=1 Tax=Tenacibaculum finnmarkense genomovar ulcerans TaxID=2781388 RepID=A0A2I2MAE4_9FLAO|nr:hypothetical protein [Tenacibaculum finnmarkense]MCD8425577.1 hypothetical protein [Tenacibaculum dicentrarchi]MBE7646254.1 hypothetical protein [Tenacibaculum finnmarkense genomovar ulcerans]MCG8762940.1 hypothetical protein [Tenacibaculum finnmarkense]MCG8788431.1 hypothetical protein [Tenacibaculum finnmarkense]MCG8883166.1 hypothetical protein [Tenacibaculum finnmarkense]